MSDTASKKPRLESEPDGQLWKLAEIARRQRELIRQKIEELDQQSISFSEDVLSSEDVALSSEDVTLSSEDVALSSEDVVLSSKEVVLSSKDVVLSSEDVVLSSEDVVLPSENVLPSEDVIPRSNSVIQLSNPTFTTRLPFPFVGYAVPERFDVDLGNDERRWFYMGREKFAELIDEFERICRDPRRTALIVYGTRGYGKSHLLAAIVCLLAARKVKVVYVPDCREFMKNPILYMRAAMLFAWADDESKQQTIMTLDTMEDMSKFLVKQSEHSEVIFVIDQLNALEKERNDDKFTSKKKTDLRDWFQSLVMMTHAILSSSANNNSILNGVPRQGSYEIMRVYGGLTEVGLRNNNSFVKWDSSNYDLEGNEPLVEADATRQTRKEDEELCRRLHRLHPIVLGQMRRGRQYRTGH